MIIGSRVVLLLVAFFTSTRLLQAPYTRRLIYVRAAMLHGAFGHFFNAWAYWDGQWYVRIAALGYRSPQSTAFFPLYPLLMAWLAPLLAHRYIIAGVALSVVCYAAAMYLLYRLVALDYGSSVASWTVVFASLFPTSFFFQAVYTESLFLLTTVACVYFARREQWLWASLAGFCAALTRNTGVLLLLPMALLYFGTREWRLRRIDRRLAWFTLVPTGLLVWMAYLQVRFGDPLAFLRAQARWGRYFSMPWNTVDRGLIRGIAGIAALSRHGLGTFSLNLHGRLVIPVALSNALALVVLVGAIVVLALAARRLKLPYVVYAIIALVAPLFSPAAGQPLFSLPRFALTNFPLFLGLALLTRRFRITRIALLVVFALTLVVLTSVFTRFFFVA
jgi:hypothetical protein